ncbi:glycoside hydrolase family 43 protein [Foetidibacter luteolus]|uniref:glycoside hydrolase family 43 protein n=1 Tax=Foetidibacter luteolus TaxID=2608880 RepID=UPI001A998E73|nr:glycoside hydrolase 43 family protein [Foetidibacter luteolus]
MIQEYLIVSDTIKRALAAFFCFYFFCFSSYGQMFDRWGDQGDGTYVNPVLPADYSDLDVIRVGNDYYAISSTMQFSPGMVVLHSVDLVNWEIKSHVVSDLTKISPELNWDKMNRYGKGIWAGSLRYYKNKFWVYFGTPDEGFFMSSATNPAGPWEPLHQVWGVAGWDDCSSFLDDDGQLYFIATNFALDTVTNKQYNIHLFKMTPDGKNLVMETDRIIYQSKGSEANKLYKINGFYYHYFSQVNTLGERYIMMGRSKNIYGPYEYKQLNKVDQLKDREPNQGGLVKAQNNRWYFLTHHGSGDWEGRPASLLPVTWINNWPIIGKVGKDTIGEMVWAANKPINTKRKLSIETNDEFNTAKLNVQWEWNYQPRADKWSLTERKGHLRLYAFKPLDDGNKVPQILRAGNTITQRSMRTRLSIVTVKMDVDSMANGQCAGLTHFSTACYSTLGVKQQNGKKYLVYDNNGKDTVITAIIRKSIWLQSTWNVNGINRYSYSFDGKTFITLNMPSQLKWGSYRGDRIGIYNYNTISEKGFVDIASFSYNYLNNAKTITGAQGFTTKK